MALSVRHRFQGLSRRADQKAAGKLSRYRRFQNLCIRFGFALRQEGFGRKRYSLHGR